MASHSNNIHEFEKIIRHKEQKEGGHSRTLYYVKWKGYSNRHNSWEPQENFVPQDIENYMERLKQNLIKRMERASERSKAREKAKALKQAAKAELAKTREERRRKRALEKAESVYDSDSSEL